jgi:hypothetical protein
VCTDVFCYPGISERLFVLTAEIRAFDLLIVNLTAHSVIEIL